VILLLTALAPKIQWAFQCVYNLHVYHSFLGEAMEKGLRDCCRSIRIGKILIKIKDESKTPVVKQLIKVHDVI